MNLASYGHSDVGFIRESNEDSFLVDDERGLVHVEVRRRGRVVQIVVGFLLVNRWRCVQ